jgi:3-hydroxyacyl-[acyl-carrier-protein] dehydratase
MCSAPVSPSRSSKTQSQGDRAILFEIDQIDFGATLANREQMFELIPHRHEMALLDRIVWANESSHRGIASMKIRGDEFWVRGHFPNKPMLPGVLMIEAGAQLTCYLYNSLQENPQVAAFLRIENAAFRRSVSVGEELILLCNVVKASSRRFVSEIQGVVEGQICFKATVSGMRIADIEG